MASTLALEFPITFSQATAMVPYDPKARWKVFFSFHGTTIPTVLLRVVALTGFTIVLCIWQQVTGLLGGWLGEPWTFLRLGRIETVAHLLLGLALGLMIVFRTNTSYDRYWEGRRLWGGLVNSSRNLVRAASAFVGEATALASLVQAYVLALKQHLRSEKDITEIQALVPEAVYAQAQESANPPVLITYYMSEWVKQRMQEGKIDSVMGRHLDTRIMDMVDFQGGCERILRTPIPFTYAAHIKQLLMIYLITLPIVLVSQMHWFAPFAIALIAFGLLGIEEAGVEIEDPFGDDPNDLPIEAMCATVARDTSALAQLPKK